MSTFGKILDEIGHLSLIISIPQLISAPASVILIKLFSPYPMPNEVIEVLDFLVISFPLTVAVALITLMLRNDHSNFGSYVAVVAGAALLSNLFHNILSSAFPAVDVASAFHEAFEPDDVYTHHGAGMLVSFAVKIISLYWKKFGIILFLQSCAIGIYAGAKYFKRTGAMPY